MPHRRRAASSYGRVHHDSCAGVRLRVRHPRHRPARHRHRPRLRRRTEPPRSRSTPVRPNRRPMRRPMQGTWRRSLRRISRPFRTNDRGLRGRVPHDCAAGGPGRSSFRRRECRRAHRRPRSSRSTHVRSHRLGDPGPPRVGRRPCVRFRIPVGRYRWRASRSSSDPSRPCRVPHDCAGVLAVWFPFRRSRRPAPPPRSAWIPLPCSFRPLAGRALRSSVLPSTPLRRRGCHGAAVLGGSGRHARVVLRASEQPASSSRCAIVVDDLDTRERGDLVARLLRRFVAHAKNPFPGGPSRPRLAGITRGRRGRGLAFLIPRRADPQPQWPRARRETWLQDSNPGSRTRDVAAGPVKMVVSGTPN